MSSSLYIALTANRFFFARLRNYSNIIEYFLHYWFVFIELLKRYLIFLHCILKISKNCSLLRLQTGEKKSFHCIAFFYFHLYLFHFLLQLSSIFTISLRFLLISFVAFWDFYLFRALLWLHDWWRRLVRNFPTRRSTFAAIFFCFSQMCLVVDAVERVVKLMHGDCNNPKYCLLQKLSGNN